MNRPRRAALQRGRSGATSCDPAQIILQSPQTELLRHRNGGTDDIIEAILYMDAHSADWITDRVECLRGDTDHDTLRNVWAFVTHTVPNANLRYRADRPGHERVKSPGALYSSGHGDCKSFSIAIGAMLRALGIPYRYRFTAYAPGDYTHVYVVATAPDTGTDVILDAVHTAYNEEVPYYKKKDIRPQQNHQIGNTPPAAPARFPFLRIGFLVWLGYLIAR